jgi:cytochrome c oxidase subunit III
MNSLDVRELPSYRFSYHAVTWWGMMGIIAIEGTVFALAVMAYFYLRSHVNTWPMSMRPPELLWGTVNTLILLASCVPNHFAKKAAEAHDRKRVRLWLGICLAFGLVFLVVRGFEFASLNCRWDSNAYGSIVWLLMGLHTAHLATDAYDSAVLEALFFTDRIDGKRYVDVSENSAYWYFVVAAWLPIYLVVYFGPRVV